jgi:broad specificity phosphatase PhoE
VNAQPTSSAGTGELRLHLVRHGESLANQADRARRTRPDNWDALSERGWAQARGLGRRLAGQGIEVIVASTMRRAQETAQGINEILGVPVETDPDLHELRQSDAFYGEFPEFGETASLNWMPTAPPDYAAQGAESFDAMLGRVVRVRERMEARAGDEQLLLVTHYGWLHFLLGHTLFGDRFGPEQLPGLWLAGHANTGISIFERRPRRMDGMDFSGWGLTTWNDQAHL